MDSNNLLKCKDPNDYTLTAQNILIFCGVEHDQSVRVDVLMEKLSPFIKKDQIQYNNLQSILDPTNTNPYIYAKQLARALEKFSQKEDFSPEDSFRNVSFGSDPEVDANKSLLVEELQTELKKKSQMLNLINQRTEYSERQHEETISSLIGQNENLRSQLKMLREENISLIHFKQDYEELSELNKSFEAKSKTATEDIDLLKRRLRAEKEINEKYEMEKQALEDLLAQTKEETHRMNEMYASRQAMLLSQNERLNAEIADINSKYRDQEEDLQLLIKEKVALEIEIKDILNRRNDMEKLEKTIDESMNDASILRTLDSLHMNSDYLPVQEDASTQIEGGCISCSQLNKSRPTFLRRLMQGIRLMLATILVIIALFVVANFNRPSYRRKPQTEECIEEWDLNGILSKMLRVQYVGERPI